MIFVQMSQKSFSLDARFNGLIHQLHFWVQLCPRPHSASSQCSLTSQLDLQPIDGKERKTKTRKAHTDANGPDPSGLPVITTQPIPPSSLHSTTPTYPIKPAEFLILGLAVVTTSRWQWVLCSVLFHATKGHTSTSQ